MKQASNALRSRRVRQSVPLNAETESSGPPVGSSFAAVDGRLDVATMLEALSPEHREVMVLRELQHLTYEEIAAALGMPTATVESRLSRARRALWKRRSGGY